MKILWFFVEKLGALVLKKIKQAQAQKEEDKKIDEHAKQVADQMEKTHDPKDMDQADADLLSGK
ncbi:MAG TPA: hypothetical protein VEF04_07895 [Blastocatellia bacterium]|nr:hypothetical protein [Blastocatellia bacterium]